MKSPQSYLVGVDLGTSSARSVVFCATNGDVVSESVVPYTGGKDGVITTEQDPLLARQDASAVGEATLMALARSVRAACSDGGVSAGSIRAVGVDATASTPIPVDEQLRPLSEHKALRENLAAYGWLWKDHTAFAEAEELSTAARQAGGLFAHLGDDYSSEWFWAKILHCIRSSSDVASATATWVELSDFVPARLCGFGRAMDVPRNICAASHKAGFVASKQAYPPRRFFADRDPELARIYDTLRGPHILASQPLGRLSETVAGAVGLSPEVIVAAGVVDAHSCALGAGIKSGSLVKILGTSACDIAISPLSEKLPTISGISGIVEESVAADHYGLEAGQAAFGDLLAWALDMVGAEHDHESLTAAASALRPGETGLLALDWHNGNRSILNKPQLAGTVLGLTLSTGPADLYRAMIEAACFGAKMIIEHIERAGVTIDDVVVSGGVALRNPLVLRILASILNRPVLVASATQAGALGAAMNAGVASGIFPSIADAQAAMVKPPSDIVPPDPADAAVYRTLFGLFTQVHDAFGGVQPNTDLSIIRPKLMELRAAALGACGATNT